MTTSGVAIGMKISRLVLDRPLKRYRPSAKAIIVPSTVAVNDAMRPIFSDSPRESQIPAAPHGLRQASRENAVQV